MLGFTRTAALGAALFFCMGNAAFAVEGAAASAVNVRTGPGTSFSIVDQLTAGEVVEIRECSSNGWCFVEHDGPDGWVSANYLTAAPGVEAEDLGLGDAGSDCSFSFVIGPDGPSLAINCGDQPPPPPPPPPPPADEAEACFYTGANYQGGERCHGLATRNSLPAAMNDAFSSVRLFGNARVRLCTNQNLGGVCVNVNASTPQLGAQLNNRASSLRVSAGAPPPPPEEDKACLYSGANYQGTERCYGPGTRNSLVAAINDAASSVRLSGDAQVLLCTGQNLGGFCAELGASTPQLGAQLNNRVSSLEVFTGGLPPPPPPEPEVPFTHSDGFIALQQTFSANLNTGAVGGAGVDIWYEAVSAAEKYVTPRNGALLARGDRSNRGYAGCSAEAFSDESIPLWDMPVGSYVCVRTNQGRISQFRLNGFTGTTMNIGYTTWEN